MRRDRDDGPGGGADGRRAGCCEPGQPIGTLVRRVRSDGSQPEHRACWPSGRQRPVLTTSRDGRPAARPSRSTDRTDRRPRRLGRYRVGRLPGDDRRGRRRQYGTVVVGLPLAEVDRLAGRADRAGGAARPAGRGRRRGRRPGRGRPQPAAAEPGRRHRPAGVPAAAGPRRGRPGRPGAAGRRRPRLRGRPGRAGVQPHARTTSRRRWPPARRARPRCASSSPTPPTSCATRWPRSAATPS